MRRREFITMLGGAAAAWPLSGRAQQADRVRRLGILMTQTADDSEVRARLNAFRQELQKLGWIEGRNIRIEYRYAEGQGDRARTYAAELVEMGPDVILANGTAILRAFREQASGIPIVFVMVPDPVGDGFVASLARPGGSVTGFTNFEFSMATKWLEILKQLAPAFQSRGCALRKILFPSDRTRSRAISDATVLGTSPSCRRSRANGGRVCETTERGACWSCPTYSRRAIAI
jgi:ABC-type uncharacterized transport system substrate-binding protein